MTDYSNHESNHILSQDNIRKFLKYGICEISVVKKAREILVKFYADPHYHYQTDDGGYPYYFRLGQYSANARYQHSEFRLQKIKPRDNKIDLPIHRSLHPHIYIGLLRTHFKNYTLLLEASILLTSIPSQEKQTISEDPRTFQHNSFRTKYYSSEGMYTKNRSLPDSHSLAQGSDAVDRKSTHLYEEKREFQTNDLKGSPDRLAQNRPWNIGTQLGVGSEDPIESIQRRLKELENKQRTNDDRVQEIKTDTDIIKKISDDLEYVTKRAEDSIRDTSLKINELEKELKEKALQDIKNNAYSISSLESQIKQFLTISQLRNINEVIARYKIDDLRKRICQDCSDLKLAENKLEKGCVEIYDQVSKMIEKISSPLPEALTEGVEWKMALENLDKEFTTIKRRKEGPIIDVIRELEQELEHINLQDFHDNGSSYSEDIKATFLSQSWTPSDPIQCYQNKLDECLKKIHTKYLHDREKSGSQLFKTSDEFRDALEKFVEKDLFPFTETSLNEIRKHSQNQEPQKSKEHKDYFDKVRAYILRRAGIEEFYPTAGTSFDEATHHVLKDQIDTHYPNNAVLETDIPGYRLNWGTKKVIRKACVIINHNP